MTVKAVILDFGGVFAEEGFRDGLAVIASRFGLHREDFFRTATEAVYNSGYVTGTGREADFWELVRARSGIVASDEELRWEILSRFIPRPRMLEIVRAVRRRGRVAAILSDQSDWLDLLDREHHFFHEFDRVFNSYHLGKTKRDASVFDDVVRALELEASEALLVDDNPAHVQRAVSRGLMGHLFLSVSHLKAELERLAVL